jgi:transposase
MLKSPTCHSFGVEGFTLTETEYGKRGVLFHIEPQKSLFICPVCGSTHVSTRGHMKRTIRTVSFGFKEESYIVVKVPKIDCHDCGKLRQMKLPFADERKSYTKQFAVMIAMTYLIASLKDVSILFRIG